jgi:hypothetical protein
VTLWSPGASESYRVLGKRGASEPYDGSPAHSPRRKRPSAIASDRALGAQLDSQQIATTSAGYRHLLFLAQELGVPAFAIEGTGSYGAGSFATSSEPASACTSASARVARSVSGGSSNGPEGARTAAWGAR